MKVYSVFDVQFNLFSEPFVAADDVAAVRLLVQTAAVSEEFRKRLSLYKLYLLADFDPTVSEPLDLMDHPLVVAYPDKLVALVEHSEHLLRGRPPVSVPPDSYLFEKAMDKFDGDSFLEKHCGEDFPEFVKKEDSEIE